MTGTSSFCRGSQLASYLVASVVLMLAPQGAPADVADSAANGFTVKITLNIQAFPDDVYRKLWYVISA